MERLERIVPVVLTQAETGFTRRWRREGLEVHTAPFFSASQTRHIRLVQRAEQGFSLVRSNWCLRRLIQCIGVDLVHCNDIRSFWSSAPAARSLRLPVIFNVRDIKSSDSGYGSKWRVARALANVVLTLSYEMANQFDNRTSKPSWLPVAPVECIYSVVDKETYRPHSLKRKTGSRNRLGISKEAFVVLYVGAVNAKKAQLEFVRQTIRCISQLPKNAQFFFIGDFCPSEDPYAQACEKFILEQDVGQRFHFVGFTNCMADWYAASDVTLLASRREGLARAMIESLACGVPVISFDVCSAHEILSRQRAGIVVAQGHYEGLVQAIALLACNSEFRRKCGENAAAAAIELFHPARNVHRYEALCASLLGSEADRELR